eukprot:Skav234147  [mRNA]  locus=scaffold361:192414:194309:- [translate_table: standard]
MNGNDPTFAPNADAQLTTRMQLHLQQTALAAASAYTLNSIDAPVELVFSFVYLGEVAVKVQVFSWDVYWLSLANRFDFFTTFLLLFSSLLPYLPNSVMPFDLRHYANILRLLRLLRAAR